MRRAVGRGLALTVLLSCAACATPHAFEGELEAGRYEGAARAFESDSTLWKRPEALLQAGRLYADPALPTFDSERARTTLDRLVRTFPRSEEASAAAPLLGILGEMDRMGGEMKALTDTLAASHEAAERDLQVLKRRIDQLERDLTAARTELERLKAIDLRPRPEAKR